LGTAIPGEAFQSSFGDSDSWGGLPEQFWGQRFLGRPSRAVSMFALLERINNKLFILFALKEIYQGSLNPGEKCAI
jgi:hypothetical protein